MILSPLSIAQPCASSNTQSPWRTGTKPSCKSSMIGLNVTLLTQPFLVTHDPQGFNNTEKKGKESHYFTILTDIPPVSINLSQTHISIVVGGTYGVFIVPSVPGGGGGEGRGRTKLVSLQIKKSVSLQILKEQSVRFKPSEILSSRAVEDSSFLSFRRNLGIVITANYMYQLQLKATHSWWHCKQFYTGGMDIPCQSKLSCLRKATLDWFKGLLTQKI